MKSVLSRRALVAWAATTTLLGTTACATRPTPWRAVGARLAPTGRLRASINLGNPVLASRDPASGQVRGLSVDLAAALAEQLGVGLEPVVTDSAAKSVDAVKSGSADIGFFAIDPMRSDGVRFTAPYLLIEGAYLVRQDSALRDNAEVDRPGIRVMVGRGSAYDLHLTRALQHARIVRAPTSPVVVDTFLAENADVAAGVRQQLMADAARLGGLRLLPGRFMVIEQAMGVEAGRGDDVAAALAAFVEWVKASGFVAHSLERHGIRGATVAPAAAAVSRP